MHDARARFARGADVTPWAMAIARRLFIDSTRRSRARPTEIVDALIIDETIASSEPCPEQCLSARETAARLEAQLAKLPVAHRDAFYLIRREGLSTAEAADIPGTTVAAVKLRAHRAYAGLRSALEPVGRQP
jgi:RNA polymerase sigma-70 factor (ECF subfamily)